MSRAGKYTTVLAFTLQASFLSAPAFAQNARGSKAAPIETMNAEIVVTARKKTERLIDVPVAATSLSSKDLERYSLASFESIAKQTPQLIIGGAPSEVGGVISLRGIGASQVSVSNDQPTSINIDGVPLSQAMTLGLGQYDLERVEVLKGPQTVYFGKNSPAGVISLSSKNPGPDFEAQARTGYEVYNEQKYLELIASGPIGGGFGARAVAYISDQDGWFENNAVAISGLVDPAKPINAPNQTEKFGRLTLTYASPDDRFNANLKVNYGEVNRDNGFVAGVQNFVCTGGAPTFNVSVTECSPNRYYQVSNIPADVLASSPNGDFLDGKPKYDQKQFLTSLEMNYNITPEIQFTSVTGYYDLEANSLDSVTSGEISLAAFRADVKNAQTTQEFRVASSFEGPWNFQAGVFGQTRETSEFGPVGFAAGTLDPVLAVEIPILFSVNKTRALSAFAAVNYKFTPKLELSVGGRYSTETREIGGTKGGGTFNDVPFDVATAVTDPKRTFDNVSPEVTLTYKPGADLTTYLSYRTGFVSGGFNDPSAAGNTGAVYNASFNQTTAKGGEVGLKGYLFDRKLRFDLTAYYYEYKGLQVSAFDPVTTAALTQNAATATIKGLEANTFISPATGLDIRFGIAYNEATYGSYSDAGCYGGQSIAAGCDSGPLDIFGGFTAQDLSGKPLQRAPKWTANTGVTYERPIGDAMMGMFSIDGSYTSSYYSLLEEDPRSLQSSYWIVNSALSLRSQDKRWEIALIGRNIFNELALQSSFSGFFTGFGTGTTGAFPSDLVGALNEPRTLALQLTLRR